MPILAQLHRLDPRKLDVNIRPEQALDCVKPGTGQDRPSEDHSRHGSGRNTALVPWYDCALHPTNDHPGVFWAHNLRGPHKDPSKLSPLDAQSPIIRSIPLGCRDLLGPRLRSIRVVPFLYQIPPLAPHSPFPILPQPPKSHTTHLP